MKAFKMLLPKALIYQGFRRRFIKFEAGLAPSNSPAALLSNIEAYFFDSLSAHTDLSARALLIFCVLRSELLHIPESCIQSAFFHKLIMRTGFCDSTLLHDIDPITVPDGSQAVGDYNAGRITAGLRDRILDQGHRCPHSFPWSKCAIGSVLPHNCVPAGRCSVS